MSLFDTTPPQYASDKQRPLADRMRPQTLEEYAGQEHILGPGKPLRIQIEKDKSMKINEEPTDFDRLGPRLEQVFKTRAERVVFVKGDPDLDYQTVARAIDIARGAGIDTFRAT